MNRLCIGLYFTFHSINRCFALILYEFRLRLISGTPQPTITWTKSDGSPLVSVPGLRQVRTDPHSSQLVYLPFAANQYQQDIHSTQVRCVATNSIGTIVSTDTQIRASESSIFLNSFIINRKYGFSKGIS